MFVAPQPHVRTVPAATLITNSSVPTSPCLTLTDNPLFSLEEALLRKLIAIGMLAPDGSLTDNARSILSAIPHRLHREQFNKFIALTEKPVAMMNGKEASQLEWHMHNQTLLADLQIDTGETYLCGEGAEFVLGVADYFVNLVMAYLNATGLSEHILDAELNALIERSSQKSPPKTIEWLEYLENFDGPAINKVKQAYEDFCRSQFKSAECFFETRQAEGFLEITIGNQSKITKRRLGSFDSLVTLNSFHIPVKFFLYCLSVQESSQTIVEPSCSNNDFNQCVIDNSLKILRFTRRPADERDGAKIAFLHSKNSFFPYGNSLAVDTNTAALQEVIATSDCSPAALACAAYHKSSNELAPWKGLKADNNLFFAEIQRLLTEVNIPLPTLRALLCFAAWVRVCHPSKEWIDKTGITVTLMTSRKKLYYILHHENSILKVSVTPRKYAILLSKMSNEQLEELQKLWGMLIPSRIGEVLPKSHLRAAIGNYTIIFDEFKTSAHFLISLSSSFLKQIGYTSVLAYQGIFRGRSGLDPVFKNLPCLLPEEPKSFYEELVFLSSITTPKTPFAVAGGMNPRDQLICFIHHLLCNHARFYGNALLENFLLTLPIEEKPTVLATLLSLRFDEHPLETLAIYQKYQAILNEKTKLEFFVNMAQSNQAELLPELLNLASSLPPCEITEEQQKILVQLIRNASEKKLFASGEKVLRYAAQVLNEENWQDSVRFFCDAMVKSNERGPIDALSTWELLSKIKSVPCPQSIFKALKLFQGQPISLSEFVLANLQPHQRIEAIQRGLCPDIPKEKCKQLVTEALQNLIVDHKEAHIGRLFNRHYFTDENCHLAVLHKLLLDFFHSDLSEGSEIPRFQFLLNLLKTRTLASLRQSLLLALSQKLLLIPHVPTRDLSGKDQLSLLLIDEMIKNASDGQFTAKIVHLLTETWTEKKSFLEKLSEIISPNEVALFNILMANDCLDEAFIFFKFIEIHNIPKSKKCISGKTLYSLFEARIAAKKTETLFSSLKFSLRSKRFDLNQSIKLLMAFIPLLEDNPVCLRECKEMLFSRLNHLKQDQLAAYFTPIMRSFGIARKEALNFLLKLTNCNKAKLFKAAKEHLFPFMPKDELLETLQENCTHFQSTAEPTTQPHQMAIPSINLSSRKSKARKSKSRVSITPKVAQPEASTSKSPPSHAVTQSALIDESTQLLIGVLEYGILECIHARQDLTSILTLMKQASFWPNSLLQAILDNYPGEDIFKILWPIQKEDAFKAPNSQKQEFFKNIFEAMLQKPSSYLMELLPFYTDWEKLFDAAFQDALKAKFLEAIIPLLNQTSHHLPTIIVVAKMRLSLNCFLQLSLENDLFRHLIASSDKDLLDCVFFLATHFLDSNSLSFEDKELLRPTLANMLTLDYKPNLAKLLRFFVSIYKAYPGEFKEQTKEYICSKLLELCPDHLQKEKALGEDAISSIFAHLAEYPTENSAENPVPVSLQLCEHYFVYFTDDFSFSTLKLIHLLTLRARLRIHNRSTDESEIAGSIMNFSKFLKTHFEDNAPKAIRNEDTLLYLNSLSGTIQDALASLATLSDRKKNLLFVEQYDYLFARLRAMNNAMGEEKATKNANQNYYINLITCLNKIQPSSFILNFIEDCFRQHLAASDEHDKKEITDCLKGYIYLLFRLATTLENVEDYRKVKKFLNDLQGSQFLTNEILQLMIIIDHLICHTIQRPLEVNEILTSSISEFLIRNTEATELSSFHEAYFLLRRVRPLFSKLPDFQMRCSEIFFNALPSLHFNHAIVFIADAASEFGEHAKDYNFYVNAIHAIISKALATAERENFIAVRIFIQALHANLELDTISLLNCYNLFFNGLKLLKFMEAFTFVKGFSEQFVRENAKVEKGKGVEEDIKLANVLFLNFFKLALLDHGFPRHHLSYSNLAATFLLQLQKIGFFEGKYSVFSHTFKQLGTKHASQLALAPMTSLPGTAINDPLSILYTNFEENSDFLTDECLTALFEVFNHHITALLPLGDGTDILRKVTQSLLKLHSANFFKNKESLYYHLVQRLMPCHLSALKLAGAGYAYGPFAGFLELAAPLHFPKYTDGSSSSRSPEQSLLFSVLRNIKRKFIPNECLPLLFSFLNEYISFLPHDEGSSLLYELFEILKNFQALGFFDKNPTLYYVLMRSLIPSNIELMKVQLDLEEVEEAKDYITKELLTTLRASTTNEIIEEKLKTIAAHTRALTNLSSSKTVAFRSELIHQMARFLKLLLEQKHFDKAFPTYLSFIKLLIPCNVSLIQSQIEKGDKGTDFIIDLLQCELVNQPLFLSSDLLLAKTELITFYAKSYIELGIPQTFDHGVEQLRQAANAIFQLLQDGFFNSKPSLYYKLVQAFIPCQLELITRKLEIAGDIEDFVFGLIMHKEIESKPAFFSSEMILKKITAVVSYYNKLTDIEHDQLQIKKLLVSHRETMLSSITSMLMRLLIGQTFNQKGFPYFLNCVQLLVGTNADLIHSQLKAGLPPTDLISDLLFCSESNLPKFMISSLIKKKLEIANQFCQCLFELKLEPANTLACAILKSADRSLKKNKN